jgi:hypothetical protein
MRFLTIKDLKRTAIRPHAAAICHDYKTVSRKIASSYIPHCGAENYTEIITILQGQL